jgi:flagellar assembly protein FliH
MSSSAERGPARTVLRNLDVVPFRPMDVTGEAPVSPRSSAHSEGYATGWAQGLREAREATAAARRGAEEELDNARRERNEAARDAVAALRSAADHVRVTTVSTATELAGDVLAAAVELAEALAGVGMAADLVGAARAAVGRTLAELPSTVPVTVRLHPADHAELIAADLAPGTDVTLVADPAVARGGAVAETDVTTVDATLAAAVARVRAELSA